MDSKLYEEYYRVICDQYRKAQEQQEIMNANFNQSGEPAKVRSEAFGQRAFHLKMARSLCEEAGLPFRTMDRLEQFLEKEKVKG